MRRLLLPLLLLPALAGCLSNDTDSLPDPAVLGTGWAAAALLDVEDNHDHRDWSQHVGFSTPNFQELAHDPLTLGQFGDASAGGYFCGGDAVTGEGRRLTVISSLDTSIAFVLVDTTDPANPEHVGDYVIEYGQTYDVDLTPDGRYVVVGANISPTAQPAPGGKMAATLPVRIGFRSGCTGELTYGPEESLAVGPSTILVDIGVPSEPSFASMLPAPVIGPHSVSTAQIGGVTYVASSITNLAHQASYFQFSQILDTPLGAQLVLQSTYTSGMGGDPTALVNGHVDAEIALHPVLDTPVVYLSDWDGGMIVLDFSIPQAPVPLGQWADQGPDAGALHSTRSIEGTYDGRHYLLAGQEFVRHPDGRPSGWVYILDDTDPADIVEVGRWTLPVEVQADWAGVELYSTHYFRVVDETVFVSMYHGGVWAFKLDLDEPENMREPASVGVFIPDQAPQNGRDPTGFYDYSPFVLDVFPTADYDLTVYDGLSGVYTVHFDPDYAILSPEPWPTA